MNNKINIFGIVAITGLTFYGIFRWYKNRVGSIKNKKPDSYTPHSK